MKKVLYIILPIALLFIIASCSSTETVNPAPQATSVDQNLLNIGENYVVQYQDCIISVDNEDKDALIVSCSLTNNTTDPIQWNGYFWINAFQDGIQLEESLMPGADADPGSIDRQVKDGATISVNREFVLNNLTSPVDIIIENYFNSDTIEVTFNIHQEF